MVDAAPKQLMDVESYFAMDRVAEEKHSYWDGEVFAMAGGSQVHAALGAAVVGELRQRLRGGPCRPHNSEQRIGLSSGRYVYPDATVICQPVETDPRDPNTILNPRVVVEVLSDTTEVFDRGDKFIGYRSVSSLQDYLLISQHSALVEHYARQDDGSWNLRTYGPGTSVAIASLGIELPVDDLYEGILPTSESA